MFRNLDIIFALSTKFSDANYYRLKIIPNFPLPKVLDFTKSRFSNEHVMSCVSHNKAKSNMNLISIIP